MIPGRYATGSKLQKLHRMISGDDLPVGLRVSGSAFCTFNQLTIVFSNGLRLFSV